jgi:hypothetical protein
MKTMKISFVILILIFTAAHLSAQEGKKSRESKDENPTLKAQEYKMAVGNSKEWKLILKDFSGKLPITGYNGNEIIITSASENLAPPEKAKGLKAIYPAGTDNTGLGLDVNKNNNQISIFCLLPFTSGGEYEIKVPENLAIEIESGCERSNEISIENMKNEIDIKNCHDIKLKNVTGPLILSTISGNIDITFSGISSEKPFSVNTISGDIDITLPVKTAADLQLRTINGGFYSDFELTDSQKNLKKIGGNELNFPLNGGGFKFDIVTVSGNIYLRKGN